MVDVVDWHVGIVGFPFGLRSEEQEPNPSNLVLAEAIADACTYVELHDSEAVVFTSWEISKALKQNFGLIPDSSVESGPERTYLNSKGLWEEAKAEFARRGIHEVIIVAQPFLHLPSRKAAARRDGYVVLKFKSGPIPFDNSPLNTQPWTRTKLALTAYAIKSVIRSMMHRVASMQNAH